MTPTERRALLNGIDRAIEDGRPPLSACAAAGVSVAWWRRWRGRLDEAGLDGLADLPRSGRPSRVRVSAEDAAALRATAEPLIQGYVARMAAKGIDGQAVVDFIRGR